MDPRIQTLLDDLDSINDEGRLKAFTALLQLAEEPVDWAYEAWDRLLEKLDHPNSYQRSIGVMLLCSLAHSDPQGRLEACLPALLAHTHDEKFITSRQTLQNCWKIAWRQPALRGRVLEHLVLRFRSCSQEKHANLLRQDVIQSLAALFAQTQDAGVRHAMLDLVDSEMDEKARKALRKLAGDGH